MAMQFSEWEGFRAGDWQEEINVRDFIQKNYTVYEGDAAFLAGPTERTSKLMEKLNHLFQVERDLGGVFSVDTEHVASLTHYKPGYLDKENELIVGLQTSRPLERGINPFGGMRMAKQACEEYGYEMSERILKEFTYRTTHNEGVFRVYTDEMLAARKIGILTGLPDAYGRGRIIGDF